MLWMSLSVSGHCTSRKGSRPSTLNTKKLTWRGHWFVRKVTWGSAIALVVLVPFIAVDPCGTPCLEPCHTPCLDWRSLLVLYTVCVCIFAFSAFSGDPPKDLYAWHLAITWGKPAFLELFGVSHSILGARVDCHTLVRSFCWQFWWRFSLPFCLALFSLLYLVFLDLFWFFRPFPGPSLGCFQSPFCCWYFSYWQFVSCFHGLAVSFLAFSVFSAFLAIFGAFLQILAVLGFY